MTLFGLTPEIWLPAVFAALMGIAILVYVVLDGFDLGVGMLIALERGADRDRMVASIGPFWDANETWLVLAVGLLLVAFPVAHGVILTELYVPVAVMLLGLTLRGVAFEFRQKVATHLKGTWNFAFLAGSTLTALAQGWMLGRYTLGLDLTVAAAAFSALIAICVASGYVFIGACWLILKTDGALQRRAVRYARFALGFVALGFIAISLASPLASERIFERWFTWPAIAWLAPLPFAAAALGLWLERRLRRLPALGDRGAWIPFTAGSGLFVLAFAGLAWSFWPYVVPGRLTVFEAAAAPESLAIILVGTLIVMPVIAAYTVVAWVIFRGKAGDLRYD